MLNTQPYKQFGFTQGILLLGLMGLSSLALAKSDPPPKPPPIPDSVIETHQDSPFSQAPTDILHAVVLAMNESYRGGGRKIAEFLNHQPSSGASCVSDYADLFAKDVIDVRLAIGYMDYIRTVYSDGSSVAESDTDAVYFDYTLYSNWNSVTNTFTDKRLVPHIGPNFSFAPLIHAQALEVLTSPCPNNTDGLQACGFTATSQQYVYEKHVPALDGTSRQVTVRLTVTQPAASSFLELNAPGGTLSSQQRQLTAISNDNYFQGLREADIILFVGHARNGGGPDFDPPVVNRYGHPDYAGFYKRYRTGARKMFEALGARRSSGRKSPYLVGYLGCLSKVWFGDGLRALAPQSRLVLTGDVSYAPGLLNGALASLDGVLRRQCHSQFVNELYLPQNVTESQVADHNVLRRGDDMQLVEPRRSR